jgi:hypothetical protein
MIVAGFGEESDGSEGCQVVGHDRLGVQAGAIACQVTGAGNCGNSVPHVDEHGVRERISGNYITFSLANIILILWCLVKHRVWF